MVLTGSEITHGWWITVLRCLMVLSVHIPGNYEINPGYERRIKNSILVNIRSRKHMKQEGPFELDPVHYKERNTIERTVLQLYRGVEERLSCAMDTMSAHSCATKIWGIMG